MKMISALSLASCALLLNAFAEEYYGIGESNTFRLNARHVESSWMDGATVHDGGMLTGDTTWSAASVHVVYGTVVVQTNVTLTIESGAVVKFVGGGLQALGSCIANGVTFTDIADGADATSAAIPVPSYVLNGNIVTDGATAVKFCREGDAFSAGGESNVFALHTREVEDSWFDGAVVHDGGMLSGNEIWEVGKIHIVYGAIVVPTNITLTIESGAIVKFIGGGIHALGTCIAKGALFTDVADGIGEGTIPVPSYMLDGNIEADSATVVKFSREGGAFSSSGESNVFALNTRNIESSWLDGVVIHDGGVLKCDETWGTGSIHVVYGTITVPDNATLTIESGVVVKFVGGGLYALGTCIANGVTFTDIADGGTHAISSSLPMPSYVLEGDFVTDDATRFKFAKMGDAFAQAGESDVFALDSTEYEYRFARDEEPITFSSAWANGANVKVSVAKSGNVVDTLVDENGLVDGIVSWARPQNAGFYELRHESGDETLTAIFAVADGVLHDGVITSDETWANGMVHVVNENVTIATGTTLTIEAGAVVKVLDGTTLTVEAGGACIAEGVTFTSIADDSIGGDTLGDGGATVPVENGYAIIGLVRDDLATVYRYGVQSYSGTLTRNDEWRMEKTYVIDGTLTVADGVTLTIPVGTVVKFTEGSELKVTNGGACSAEGVIFTHIADDSVGGDTMGDGDATKPEYGKYTVDVSVLDNDATEYRYSAPITTSGTIYGNVVWRARQVYHVTGNLTLASGATLTIAPGSVIKFNPNVSFTVNSGATLNAQGTRSSQVVFTSFKDDAHGGDTNGDGNNSVAQGGDWGTLSVSGVANFDYTTIQYGGSDIVRLNSNGTINFNNSEIAHANEYCVDLEGGTWNMRNSVFRDFYTAFRHWSTTFSCINSVFYDCSYISNNGGQSFVNCIFERYSLGLCWWTDNSTYRNCAFWNSPEDTSSPQSCTHAGSNGNIWGDPKFENAEKGDYRIKADSPCVDAGDGTVAPAKDYYNQPRQTIQTVTPTGTPKANGAYADIGIYEVQPRYAGADIDLEVRSVTVPETLTVGEQVTISWREANIGSVDTDGKWYDKVELVSANGAVVTLGTVPVTGIVAGGEKTITEASFHVPAVAEGTCIIRVTANYQRDIYEGSLTANNVCLSEWRTVSLPTIESEDYKRITLVGGGSTALRIPSDSGISAIRVSGGQNVAAFAGAGYVPVALRYDVAAVALADGSYLLVLPKSADESDFYLTLQNGGSSNETVLLETSTDVVSILDVLPSEMSNTGLGYLTIHGIGMDRATGVKLEGTSTRVAFDVKIVSPGELTATVDMANAAEGNYGVIIETEGGEIIRTTTMISVYKPRLGAKLQARLEIPEAVRQNRIYTGKIIYSNVGDTEMFAPYLAVEAVNAKLRLPGEEDWTGDSLNVIGVASTYPAGMLCPGDEAEICFEFKSSSTPTFSLDVEFEDAPEWEVLAPQISEAVTILNRRGRMVCDFANILEYVELCATSMAVRAACGTLVTSAGSPAKDATVVAIDSDGNVVSVDAVDRNGVFVLSGLIAGTNYTLRVASGARAGDLMVVIPEDGDLLNVPWEAEATCRLNVEITGLPEDELDHVIVSCVSEVGANDIISRPYKNIAENPLLALCNQVHYVTVSTFRGGSLTQKVSVGAEEALVSFNFADASIVTGLVQFDDGTFASNVLVTAYAANSINSQEVYTDENGVFVFYDLPDGQYRLEVTSDEGACASSIRIDVDGTHRSHQGVNFALTRHKTALTGTIASAMSPGYATIQSCKDGRCWTIPVYEDGIFSVSLPNGEYTVFAVSTNQVIKTQVKDVTINGDDVSVSLEPQVSRRVVVRLQDEDGNAMEGSVAFVDKEGSYFDGDVDSGTVALEVPDGDYWIYVITSDFVSGVYRARVAQNCSMVITLSPEDSEDYDEDEELPDDNITTEYEQESVITIEGKVVDSTGLGVIASLRFYSNNSELAKGDVSGECGYFIASGVPADYGMIWAYDDNGNAVSISRQMFEDAGNVITLSEYSGNAVEIRLTTDQERKLPLFNTSVILSLSNGNSVVVQTDINGIARFAIPSGDYVVELSPPYSEVIECGSISVYGNKTISFVASNFDKDFCSNLDVTNLTGLQAQVRPRLLSSNATTAQWREPEQISGGRIFGILTEREKDYNDLLERASKYMHKDEPALKCKHNIQNYEDYCLARLKFTGLANTLHLSLELIHENRNLNRMERIGDYHDFIGSHIPGYSWGLAGVAICQVLCEIGEIASARELFDMLKNIVDLIQAIQNMFQRLTADSIVGYKDQTELKQVIKSLGDDIFKVGEKGDELCNVLERMSDRIMSRIHDGKTSNLIKQKQLQEVKRLIGELRSKFAKMQNKIIRLMKSAKVAKAIKSIGYVADAYSVGVYINDEFGKNGRVKRQAAIVGEFEEDWSRLIDLFYDLKAKWAEPYHKKCPDKNPKTKVVETKTSKTPTSNDPNDMVGPAGVGEERYVKPGEPMDYTIYFENQTNATAAAQDVYVTLPKDAGLDWTTFKLGEVVFGDNIDTTLSGYYEGESTYALPGTNWSVRTEVTHTADAVKWHLRIIDPTTANNYPEDAYAGFLPPNDPATHCGEGHLRFSVNVKDDATPGSVIRASAVIEFDPLNGNKPIETDPAWSNKVAQVASVKVNGDVEGDVTDLDLIVGLPYGELPTPKARAGYAFDGWYTGPNGTGRRVRSESVVQAGDGGIYAYWIACDYTVTFDANGGVGGWSREMEYGTEINAPTVTREGYTFAGWQPALLGTVPASNVTFTAQWEPITPEPEPAPDPMPEPTPGPTVGPTVDPAPAPVAAETPRLWTEVTGAAPAVAALYEGCFCDGAGNVKGTIQVKVGKPGKKDGRAAVSAVVVGLGGKKTKLKAAENGKAKIEGDGPTTVEFGGGRGATALPGGGTCVVTLGAKGMSGTYGSYAIDGSLNVFASKDAANKTLAAGVLGKWQGAVNVAWRLAGDGSPYQTLAINIAAKGKAKVSGTLADGTKVSAKGQLVVGDNWCCVPVVCAKKGAKLAFNVWLPVDATERVPPVVVGIDDAIVGKPGSLKGGAAFRIDAAALEAALGKAVLPYLPDGLSVTGGAKWTLPKAGSVTYEKGTSTVDAAKAGENPSALKLTYKAKDGTFKGSFKAYADVGGKPKSTTVNVTGVLVDGVGYGAATVKNVGSVGMRVE